MIKKYILLSDKIDVIEGGATRNDTIMNAISHIEKFYGLDEETIIRRVREELALAKQQADRRKRSQLTDHG